MLSSAEIHWKFIFESLSRSDSRNILVTKGSNSCGQACKVETAHVP